MTQGYRRRRKKRVILPKLLILLMILAAVVGYMYIDSLDNAINPNDTTKKEITIDDGTPSLNIAKILKDNGLIKNDKYFLIYAKKKNLMNLKSGVYEMSPSQNMTELLQMLNKGGRPIGEKVTIKEGMTIAQIAEQLAQAGLVDKDAFIGWTYDKQVFAEKYKFLKDPSITTLEGFLYPETYFIKKGTSESEIISMMLEQTESLYSKSGAFDIPANLSGYIKNVNDLITLASIVEKETSNKKDAPLVTGVFMHRLQIGMALQSCVTVEYVTGVHKARLTYEESRIDSPYNTYIHKGLPPTPICTPTVDTINAVKNFTPTDYLYFVAKKDGTIAFSTTYEQHIETTKNIYGAY